MRTNKSLKSVETAFKKGNWEYIKINEEVIEASFEGHHTHIRIHIQIFPEIKGIHVVSSTPASIKETHEASLFSLLNEANITSTIGNFEYQKKRDIVIFRAVNLFETEKFSPTIILSLIHSAIAEIDYFSACVSTLRKISQEKLGKLDPLEILTRKDLYPHSDSEY